MLSASWEPIIFGGEEGRTVVISMSMIVPWGQRRLRQLQRAGARWRNFSFHPERDSFRFTRREQALFPHARCRNNDNSWAGTSKRCREGEDVSGGCSARGRSRPVPETHPEDASMTNEL